MNLADVSKILIAGGIACTGYFFFLFDTSVPVPTMTIGGNTVGGGRVNNIGLLSQKQNGINLGMGGAILGAILLDIQTSALSPKEAHFKRLIDVVF